MKKLIILILITLLSVVGCKEKKKKPEEQVSVAFHVMSQCPYGVMVENAISPVLRKLGNTVDFKLHYIGNEKSPGNFSSLHGEKEVKGNIQQLCVMKYEPEKSMDFIDCVNKEYRKIPNNFAQCLKTAKIENPKIKKCVDGDEGKKLISESFKVSSKAGAKGSPTIFIAGEKYTGGRTELDFMRSICKEFKKAKPKACNDIPEPMKISLTVLTDARCKKCETKGLLGRLKSVFPGLQEKVVDYKTAEGKKLYAAIKNTPAKLLPAFLFAKEVEKDPGYKQVGRFMVNAGDYKALRVGGKFDPTAEICDNKIDDNNNKKVDCDDPTCSGKLICRKEIKNKLDVFVMSQCPYGVLGLNAMEEVLKAFDNKIDFDIHFIANETSPGKFKALHGQPEVDENIRQLCAIKHYGKNYKYMDYILCRNKNIKSTDWKKCAKNGIKASVIEKCSNGKEGIKLHSEDIKIAQGMGVGASPTWVANNKYKFSGIAPDAIKTQFCKHNPGKKGCEKKLKSGSPVPKNAGCGSK